MSTKSHEELPSIDPTQLSAVTGGVTTDTSSTDTLTTMMQQMMSLAAGPHPEPGRRLDEHVHGDAPDHDDDAGPIGGRSTGRRTRPKSRHRSATVVAGR